MVSDATAETSALSANWALRLRGYMLANAVFTVPQAAGKPFMNRVWRPSMRGASAEPSLKLDHAMRKPLPEP
jgi:hypothetical protein